MKLEKLEKLIGQNVYNVGKVTMGNTSMKTVAVWPVHIVSVDHERQTVMAKWNGNEVRKYHARQWSKWRAEAPLLVKSGMGMRLASREEIAENKKVISEQAKAKSNTP